MNLATFREALQRLMKRDDLRPFTCAGSPLDCELFIVGLNSATTLQKPFWHYWSDVTGFDRAAFDHDYAQIRRKHGVRPNIERFVSGAQPLKCLETNIYSVPTSKSRDLRSTDKNASIFLFLLDTIRPKGIFVHSNEPIEFLRSLAQGPGCTGEAPVPVTVRGIPMMLWGCRGPFYLKSRESAAEFGRRLASAVRREG